MLFLIAFTSTILLQSLYCCRIKHRFPIFLIGVLCFVTSFLHLVAFTYMWFIWTCNNFISIDAYVRDLTKSSQNNRLDGSDSSEYSDGSYSNGTVVDGILVSTYSDSQICSYEEWVARAIVGFITYFLTASTLLKFIASGGIERCYEEEQYRIQSSHDRYYRQQRNQHQLMIALETAASSSDQMLVEVIPISEAAIRRLRRQEQRRRNQAQDSSNRGRMRRIPELPPDIAIFASTDDRVVGENEDGEEETIATSSSESISKTGDSTDGGDV